MQSPSVEASGEVSSDETLDEEIFPALSAEAHQGLSATLSIVERFKLGPVVRLALVLHLGVLRTLVPGRADPANAGYFEVASDALELDPRLEHLPN